MMKKIIGTIIISFFLLVHVFASDIPCYDIGKPNFELKDFTLGLIIDSNQVMDINQIAEIKEFQLTNSRFAIKSIDNNYWFIFKVHNSSSETVKQIVGFDEVYMETADFYYLKDTVWHHEQNGLSQPINHRGIKNRCPIFYISLKAGETKTVYLKLHSKFTLVVGVLIENTSEYIQEEQVKIIGYWTYFGAALAILIYNLFLLFSLRDKAYLYYVIYAICIIIFTFLYSGFALYVNSNVHLHYILHSSIAIVGFGVSMFTRELLNPKKISKWIDKVLIAIAVLYIILALLIIIDIYFYQWLVLFGMPSMLFLLYVGIFSMIKKNPLASYYVFAMSGYLIGLFMIAAVNLAIIPFNNITRYGFLIGSIIELIVFSLALAYRVKLLQEEKNIFQNKLIANEKSIKNKLEIQVQKRTKDLVNVSEELKTTIEELSLQVQEKNNAMAALKKSEMNLRESNLTKDKFFSIIAHDLKGPFNSMLGFSSLLNERNDDFDASEQKQFIGIIHQALTNTHKLLDNLLLWARSQKGVIEFNPTQENLFLLINEIIELFRQQANKKSLILINEIPESIFLEVDKNMFLTILRNLVSNAIKFTSKGGIITLRSRSVTNENKQIFTEISIIDSGIGVSLDNQSKLFSLEESSLSLGTEKESGSGLGLILCKEFVERHGGNIWVESKFGEGSTFRFTIPS